jgi:hypothetical protein
MNSLVQHPDWQAIRVWLRAERYDRDRNFAGDLRNRIEVLSPETPEVRTWLLRVKWPCARCGVPIYRIRERSSWGTLYFAAACPLDENVACSRGHDAAEEYRKIVEDLLADPIASPQGSLF